jgi:RNase adaptor protein for sRNA GlmZ degradation
LAGVCSFGFRNGVPDDLTHVFDCRCVANPDRHLRRWTGIHPEVADQVLARPEALALLDEAEALARAEPDARIGFGCHYGYHRSVVLAEALAARLGVLARHFDLE